MLPESFNKKYPNRDIRQTVITNNHNYVFVLTNLTLCISTSFWVLRAAKSWSKPFYSRFLTFFVHFKAFSVISRLNSYKKRLKMNKKTCLCLLLKAGRQAKAGRLHEEVPQNCLFSVDFLLFLTFFSIFRLITVFFLLIYKHFMNFYTKVSLHALS